MASSFTTGIPEFDRVTENKIENGSFLLLTGNDDEGIASFSAAIEKSTGRFAEKEVPVKTEKSDCIFLKITPENRNCLKGMCFEQTEKAINAVNQASNQTPNQTKSQIEQEALTESS